MESYCNHYQNYLIIESFVYFNIEEHKLLFYNTFDGYLFECTISSDIAEIFGNNCVKYVYQIKYESLLKDNLFMEFIKNLELHNIGFILRCKKEPLQIPPLLNVMTERFKSSEKSQLNDYSLSHLNEISVYLNSNLESSSDLTLKSYKQFLCNYKSSRNNPELNFQNLFKFILPSLEKGTLQRINLLGGNILEYSKLGELVKIFIDYQKKINLYLELESNYQELFNQIPELKKCHDISLYITLRIGFSKNSLINFINYFSENIPLKILCIIESESDFKIFEQNLNDIDLENILFKPFYNGKNLQFFKKNVFIEKEDVFQAIHEQDDIYRKLKLNLSEFGKLIILNDGNVYCNINQEPVGNINENNIQEIVYDQITSKKSVWFNTKNKDKVCSKCLYNAFCPSISNYEYVLNKSNLCHINQN